MDNQYTYKIASKKRRKAGNTVLPAELRNPLIIIVDGLLGRVELTEQLLACALMVMPKKETLQFLKQVQLMEKHPEMPFRMLKEIIDDPVELADSIEHLWI